MRPLSAERVADSRQKVSRYLGSLASAGQRDAKQLMEYGLACLKELHEGRDPRSVARPAFACAGPDCGAATRKRGKKPTPRDPHGNSEEESFRHVRSVRCCCRTADAAALSRPPVSLHLAVDDPELAAEQLIGAWVGMTELRQSLGVAGPPSSNAIAKRVRYAIDTLVRACGRNHYAK
jgi:hypothetical protein